MPSTVLCSIKKFVDMSTKFDEAAVEAFATFNELMNTKFEAILENAELKTIVFQQALATLHQGNQEFQQQFMVNMQNFQINMLVASQQDMIDCIMNNQATLLQALQTQINVFDLSVEQQALQSLPTLPGPKILANLDSLSAPSSSSPTHPTGIICIVHSNFYTYQKCSTTPTLQSAKPLPLTLTAFLKFLLTFLFLLSQLDEARPGSFPEIHQS
jgi:hypothetical protein